jgi:hypothetical protein
MNPPGEPPKRVVVPATTRREMLLSVLAGAAVLGFVVYGVFTMGARQQSATTNTLTGKVVRKKFTPRAEEQVSFGSKGARSQHLAGEYVFEVEVKGEQRTFEVPVDAATYEAVHPGASFSFMRPRSEQKK